nr:hypothetical protein [Aeromonas media]
MAWRQDHRPVRPLKPGVFRGRRPPDPVYPLLPR